MNQGMKLELSLTLQSFPPLLKPVSYTHLDVYKRQGQDEPFEICLTMVSNAEIRELNFNTRGLDKITDVLSFPMLERDAIQSKRYTYEDRNPQTGADVYKRQLLYYARGNEYSCIKIWTKQNKKSWN